MDQADVAIVAVRDQKGHVIDLAGVLLVALLGLPQAHLATAAGELVGPAAVAEEAGGVEADLHLRVFTSRRLAAALQREADHLMVVLRRRAEVRRLATRNVQIPASRRVVDRDGTVVDRGLALDGARAGGATEKAGEQGSEKTQAVVLHTPELLVCPRDSAPSIQKNRALSMLNKKKLACFLVKSMIF